MELLHESSWRDLILILLPYTGILSLLLITLSLIYDPTMTIFMYSSLPENWKTWRWFLVCLLLEVRSMANSVALAIPAIQIHVIAFDLVIESLQKIADTLNS